MMESLGMRIFSTLVEATIGALAMGGLIVVVRGIQIAFGMKSEKPETTVKASSL